MFKFTSFSVTRLLNSELCPISYVVNSGFMCLVNMLESIILTSAVRYYRLTTPSNRSASVLLTVKISAGCHSYGSRPQNKSDCVPREQGLQ